MNKVLSLSQRDALGGRVNNSDTTTKTNRLVFVTTYNPHSSNIAKLVNKRRNLLNSQKGDFKKYSIKNHSLHIEDQKVLKTY